MIRHSIPAVLLAAVLSACGSTSPETIAAVAEPKLTSAAHDAELGPQPERLHLDDHPVNAVVEIEALGVKVFDRVEAAIEWADVLNVLRLQLERMQGGFVPSLREYNRVFGVTEKRLARANREILILHPGPMNRGVEIDSAVADGPQSVILQQVTNGVAVRMAVLYLLAGGKPEAAEAAKTGVAL